MDNFTFIRYNDFAFGGNKSCFVVRNENKFLISYNWVPANSPGSGRNTRHILCVQWDTSSFGITAGKIVSPSVQNVSLDIVKKTLLSVLRQCLICIHKWWWENAMLDKASYCPRIAITVVLVDVKSGFFLNSNLLVCIYP